MSHLSGPADGAYPQTESIGSSQQGTNPWRSVSLCCRARVCRTRSSLARPTSFVSRARNCSNGARKKRIHPTWREIVPTKLGRERRGEHRDSSNPWLFTSQQPLLAIQDPPDTTPTQLATSLIPSVFRHGGQHQGCGVRGKACYERHSLRRRLRLHQQQQRRDVFASRAPLGKARWRL